MTEKKTASAQSAAQWASWFTTAVAWVGGLRALAGSLTWFKGWIKEWQDGLIWVPVALGLVIAARFILPEMDPRAGIDGLGALYGYAVLLLKGVVVLFMAWLCKRTYTRDMGKDEERAMWNDAREGTWQPLVIDRGEWVIWIGFWFFCLSQ